MLLTTIYDVVIYFILCKKYFVRGGAQMGKWGPFPTFNRKEHRKCNTVWCIKASTIVICNIDYSLIVLNMKKTGLIGTFPRSILYEKLIVHYKLLIC